MGGDLLATMEELYGLCGNARFEHFVEQPERN